MVLLKGIEDEGFIFYTNYESRKGKELEYNPYISILFFWPEAERQIRIEGKVSKISTESSKEYFVSRPRESQLGAWASAQSSIIQGRHSIEESYQQCLAQYEGKDIPLPDFWGGYIIHPSSFEFWQGRPSRLHDRMKYTKEQDSWHIVRLSP